MKQAVHNDTQVERLEYVSEMIGELRHLAIDSGAKDLGHILEVALLEAELQLKIGRNLQ